MLLVAVLAAAVVLLPGVARAEGPGGLGADPLGTGSDPLGTVTGSVTDILTGVTGTGGERPTGGGSGPGESPTPLPAPGAPDPAQLHELLEQLAAQLQISPECVDGVLEGVQVIIGDLTELPQELQDQLSQLAAALQQGGDGLGQRVPLGSLPSGGAFTLPALDPSSRGTGTVAIGSPEDLGGSSLAEDLQALLMTFQYDCLSPEPTPPSGGDSPSTPPATPPAAGPPAPAAAPVVAQPVSYPGYAPTGGALDRSAGPVPLAALAGVVLLSGVGAAGYRMRSRAARSDG